MEILRVQEIKGYSAIMPIPNTPPYTRAEMMPHWDMSSRRKLAASTGYGTWLDSRTRRQLGALLTWTPPMVNN